jgi:hypothetical protein
MSDIRNSARKRKKRATGFPNIVELSALTGFHSLDIKIAELESKVTGEMPRALHNIDCIDESYARLLFCNSKKTRKK